MPVPIKMVQFPGAYGLSSLSPFCTKLEAYFRLAKLDYELTTGNPRLAPKGKLPYIVHDGTKLADSGAIIEYFEQKLEKPLDAGLGAEQQALGLLVRRTLEEHTYWAMVYARWIDEPGWALQADVVKKMLPAALRPFLPGVIRSAVKKSLHAHGAGRHSHDELYAGGVRDVDAIAQIMGDKPWALGSEPSSYDATVMAFLWHMLAQPTDNPLTRAVKRHPSLVSYVERTKQHLGW